MERRFSSEMSSVIKFVRFPLIFFVVCIHSFLPTENETGRFLVLDAIQHAFFFVLPPRNPTFFFMSAFLFFFSFSSWQWDKYGEKLYKRFFSLFIPYIIWNSMVIFYFFLAHRFFPGLINPNFENVEQFSFIDWVRAFWDGTGGYPIAYQLWFLRDLMVMCLFAPLFYALLKPRFGWFIAGFIAINFLFDFIEFPHLQSITWFTLGSFFALHNIDFVHILKETKYVVIVLYVISAVATFFSDFFKPICVFWGVFAIFDISRLLINKEVRIPAILVESAFFIYLFHGFPIKIITKFISSYYYDSETMLICGLFLTPFVMVAFSVLVFTFLRRLFPTITNVLIGKRISK